MGVKHLWKLVNHSGVVVQLEGLAGKKLAVDVSIWMARFVKAIHKSNDRETRSAHLQALFHRCLKLLFYQIRPVFVFDGERPALKRNTLLARRMVRIRAEERLDEAARKMVLNRMKQNAIRRIAEVSAAEGQEGNAVADVAVAQEAADAQSARQLHEELNGMDQSAGGVLEALTAAQEEELEAQDGDEEAEEDVTTMQADMIGDWMDMNIDLTEMEIDLQVFRTLPKEVQQKLLQQLNAKRKSMTGFRKLFDEQADEGSDMLATFAERSAKGTAEADGQPIDFSALQLASLVKRGRIAKTMDDMQRILHTEGTHSIPSQPHRMYQHQVTEETTIESLFRKREEEVLSAIVAEQAAPAVQFEYEEILPDVPQRDTTAAMDIMFSDSDASDQELPPASAKRRTPETSLEEPPTKRVARAVTNSPLVNVATPTERAVGGVVVDLTGSGGEEGGREEAGIVIDFDPMGDESYEDPLFAEVFTGQLPSPTVSPGTTAASVARAKAGHKVRRSSLYSLGLVSSQGSDSTDMASGGEDLLLSQESRSGREEETDIPVAALSPDVTEGSVGLASLSPAKGLGEQLPISLNLNQEKDVDVERVEKEADLAQEVSRSSRGDDEVLMPSQEAGGTPAGDDISSSIHAEGGAEPRVVVMLSDEDEGERKAGLRREGNGPRVAEPLKDLEENRSALRDNEPEDDEEEGKETEGQALATDVPEVASGSGHNAQEESDTQSKDDEAEGDEGEGAEGERPKELIEIPDSDTEGAKGEAKEVILVDSQSDVEITGSLIAQPAEEQAGRALEQIQEQLEEEARQLTTQAKQYVSTMASVGDELTASLKTMLSLFGFPFVTGPFEAEAQCAELYRLQLVDGVISDDSDTLLFGGKVYKNMFNRRESLLVFHPASVELECGFSRNQLIELALLLGSDYTEGVRNIGPKTAVLVIDEFGSLEGFREWYDLAMAALELEKEKLEEDLPEGEEDDDDLLMPDVTSSRVRRKLWRMIQKGTLKLDSSFPSREVVAAYLQPGVDSSKETFRWQRPSEDALVDYACHKFHWSEMHARRVIQPAASKAQIRISPWQA